MTEGRAGPPKPARRVPRRRDRAEGEGMTKRQLVSSGRPYEPVIGFSRAVRPACTFVAVSRFIDPDWLVEIEADAYVAGG